MARFALMGLGVLAATSIAIASALAFRQWRSGEPEVEADFADWVQYDAYVYNLAGYQPR